MKYLSKIVVALAVMQFLASAAYSMEQVPKPVSCHQFPEHESVICKRENDGRIVVSNESLKIMHFSHDGMGAIFVDGLGLYFVSREGKTQPAFVFDNGPDLFVEGLALTVHDKKMGFVNRQLDQVIAPVWDFAFPFEHGLAVVCKGCSSVSKDEHETIVGGKWGYINTQGKVVVPVTYESQNLPPSDTVK